MLKSVEIRNIALIDYNKIEFFNGLNILTGETGSGKSIIIDALSFVLGARPDKTLIKSGSEKCEVFAVFENISKENLEEINEIIRVDENLLRLYRSFSIDGKSECKINDIKVSAANLKLIASVLIDIHGQNEHHKLLNEKHQLEILDSFSGAEILPIKKELLEICKEISAVKTRIKNIGGTKEERERTAEFLSFQIDEIEKAKIVEGEAEELKQMHSFAVNRLKIAEALNGAQAMFNGNEGEAEGVNSLVAKACYLISQISEFGEYFKCLDDRLKSFQIEASDILSELESFSNNENYDESDFNKLDERLDLLKKIFKKYGGDETEVLKTLSDFKLRLSDLINSEELLEKLNKKLTELNDKGLNLSEKLSVLRKKYAEIFESQVKTELSSLGMKYADFEIFFDSEEKKSFTKNGYDEITYLFSANVGEQLKPLSKIISGGELSRLILAIKTLTAFNDGTSSMIFDEVDSGISGQMGQIVAEKMAVIARNKQVVAISHLPQIAAMADHNFYIEKTVENNKTKTTVSHLSKEERIYSVARLIGSTMAGTHATSHAKELIESGESFKKAIN